MPTTLPTCKRNWVAIAVNIVGGIYPAARICHVRPTTLKRWYWRGWVERVDKAWLLSAATGLSVIRLVGFKDMPSLGKRRGTVRPMILPQARRRGPRIVLTYAREKGDRPRSRVASRRTERIYVGRANW